MPSLITGATRAQCEHSNKCLNLYSLTSTPLKIVHLIHRTGIRWAAMGAMLSKQRQQISPYRLPYTGRKFDLVLAANHCRNGSTGLAGVGGLRRLLHSKLQNETLSTSLRPPCCLFSLLSYHTLSETWATTESLQFRKSLKDKMASRQCTAAHSDPSTCNGEERTKGDLKTKRQKK